MKKLIMFTLAIMLVSFAVLGGCGEEEEPAAPAAPAKPAPAEPAKPAPGAPEEAVPGVPGKELEPERPVAPAPPKEEEEAQYGGKLTVITTGGPTNVGYMPIQSFSDAMASFLYSERPFLINTVGDLAPNVCTGYEYSEDRKTIILHLRKGVKYWDGTDFNAEALTWTMRECKETGALAAAKRIDSIDVIDMYTISVTLNEPNNQVVYDLWRPFVYSPTAFKQNGKEWAINHSVSTHSLHVNEFKQDSYVKMERNNNYWREGFPYLDGAELLIVREPATCVAMMKAGQADLWKGVTGQEAAELKEAGFEVAAKPTTYQVIYPDSTNPDSPFANKKVREAIEYAIDRPAVAEALGFGFMDPVFQPTHEGTAGYNPDYPVREYNPDKAKQLIEEAGYASGIKTKMVIRSTAINDGAIIKEFLTKIGIDVELDIADTGRYWGAVNGGWEGLLLGPLAVNPEFCVAWLDHVGPQPIMKFISMAKSPEYLQLCDELVVAPDVLGMRQKTMEMVTQAGLDAMFIPIYVNLGCRINRPEVHTDHYVDLDWTDWSIWNDWIEQ